MGQNQDTVFESKGDNGDLTPKDKKIANMFQGW